MERRRQGFTLYELLIVRDSPLSQSAKSAEVEQYRMFAFCTKRIVKFGAIRKSAYETPLHIKWI
jgi:hypothetical protein